MTLSLKNDGNVLMFWIRIQIRISRFHMFLGLRIRYSELRIRVAMFLGLRIHIRIRIQVRYSELRIRVVICKLVPVLVIYGSTITSCCLSLLRPMLVAWAFLHPASQSGTVAFQYRTEILYTGAGLIPVLALFFIPVPD
jgi:hypothetical protein